MPNETAPIQCPDCQSAVRRIPAGVSKRTGKPYNEFWACINRECRFTWRPTKTGGFQKAVPIMIDEHEEIMKGLRAIYLEIKDLEKEFREFARIFGGKQEDTIKKE